MTALEPFRLRYDTLKVIRDAHAAWQASA